jgi:RNA recognition motif-containing protein
MSAKDSQPAVAAPAPAAAETKVEPKAAAEAPVLSPAELAKQKEEKEKRDAEWAKKEALFQAEREAREYQKTNTKLFISNLPRNYKRGDIENLCQRYGKITQTIVNTEKRWAFVTFSTREDAQYAIYDLQEKSVGGNTLRVSWSKPSEKEVQKKEAEKAARAKTDPAAPPAPGAPGTAVDNKPKAADDKTPAAGKAPGVAGKDSVVTAPAVPEVEKPRFSAQQKPKQAPPKPQAPPQKAVAQPKPAQHHPPQHQPAPRVKQPKQVPQRFRVTIQNETSGGETVGLSISYEDWQKYILPLLENNRLQINPGRQ